MQVFYEGIEKSLEIPGCPVNAIFKWSTDYITTVESVESFEDLYVRIGEFLKEVVAPRLECGEDVLIVGHDAMNSSIICQVKHMQIEKFWSAGIENCKLIRLL